MSKLKSDVYNTDDHIYYNVIISNPTAFSIPATFAEDRVQPLVDDPSLYYLSIVRFLVPGQNVPIFIFSPQSYSITLSYNGVDYQRQVVYDPLTNTSLTSGPFGGAGYYFVYSYQHFIDMINATFAYAFESLVAANPGVSVYPPYLTFDPVSQLITLNCESTTAGAYSPVTEGGNYIKIYMNDVLYSFFENFENKFGGEGAVNGKVYQILVKNNGNNTLTTSNSPDPINFPVWNSQQLYYLGDQVFNPADSLNYVSIWTNVLPVPPLTNQNLGWQPNLYPAYWKLSSSLTPPLVIPTHYTGPIYQMRQEFASLYNWNSFRNIVFTTGSIPIQAEFTPTLVNGLVSNEGLQNYKKILTDFQPVVTEGPDARSYFQYYPQSEYRLVSFNSEQPLRRFDVTIYWESNAGQLFPILIPPYDEVSIKFLFRKKSFNGSRLTADNIAQAIKRNR